LNGLQNILVARTDRLGDVLLTLPMLPVLRSSCPGARLSLLLRSYPAELVRGHACVSEVLPYDEVGRPVPFPRMVQLLRSRRYDAVFVVSPSLRLALLMLLARIPVRVGTAYRYYSFLFNRRVYDHRKDARFHELEYNLRLLRGVGLAVPEFPFEAEYMIPRSAAAERTVGELLRREGVYGKLVVVVHPGSGGSAREWPRTSLVTLVRGLADLDGTHVVLTGTRDEAGLVEMVARDAGGKPVSLAGRLSLPELASLFRMSALCVAHSTGPLHLAAAVGCPVVGLYPQLTPMSPARWGPYTSRKTVFVPDKPADCDACSGDRREECACMASISVDEVFAACKDVLRTWSVRSEVAHAR
jgi:ADP-heptose:LPS heptosyltransferase